MAFRAEGKRKDASRARMAMTTRSSISVYAANRDDPLDGWMNGGVDDWWFFMATVRGN